MYNDVPINVKSEDKLHRMAFVNSLARAIKNYQTYNESIVIGLMGNWGSGKSSIINLLESELGEEVIILKFNPWNFPSKNQLILSFFDELLTTINKYDFDTKIKVFLSKYKSKMLDSAIDIGSSYFKPVKFISIFNKNEEYTTLNDLKSSLKEAFKNQKKILIIIDDIDRLNPDEIKEIFQLVKSLADFPNIIYLLAFDKDYVNYALKDWNISSEDYSHSEDFIDKIVQVPLVVPKFDEIDLYKIFSSKMDTLEEHHGNIGNMDKELIFNLLIPYFKNIRDINRYFNSLDFNLSAIEENIHFNDFALVTALQIFEKEVYDEIRFNGDLLIGNYDSWERTKYFEQNKKGLKSFLNKIFGNVDNEKFVKLILAELFPKVNWVCYEKSIGDDELYQKIKDGGICNHNFFNSYFTFFTNSRKLSKSRILSIIYLSNDSDEFYHELLNIKEGGLIYNLFEMLNNYYIKDFSKENVSNVISVLLNHIDELFAENQFYIVPKNSSSIIADFILSFSELYENGSDFKDLLKRIIFESEKSFFKVFLVYSCYFNRIFIESELNEIYKPIIDFFNDIFSNDIHKIPKLKWMIEYWNFFSGFERVDKYIKQLNKSDLIYLISCLYWDVDEFYIQFDLRMLEKLVDLKYIHSVFSEIKEENNELYNENKDLIDSFLVQ